MRGAIYSRVSTEEQDYSKQTNELKDYASRNGIEVVYVFEEKESGFNNDRPEFQKLMKLTKSEIDVILVWELSRISRRAIYLQQQVQEFTDNGINIFALKEGVNTLNADCSINISAKTLIGFVSIIAEQEAATLKERTISSRRNHIFREGKSYTGTAPYGYDIENKTLIINEKEAEVVRKIFDLSIEGYSAYRIPIILNSEGIFNKKGNKWTVGTIRTILENPVYMGKAEYCVSSEKPKKGKKYRKILRTETVNTPAIITPEIFEQSKEQVKARTNRSKSFGTKYLPLLRGLIVCPNCGRKYTFKASSKYYFCNNVIDGKLCNTKTITSKLDSIIWNVIKIYFYKELAAGKAKDQITPLQNEIESFQQQVLSLNGERSKLIEEANTIINTAIEIKIQFPNMPELYNNKMKEVEDLNKESGRYNKEIERLEKRIHLNETRIKNINKVSRESGLVESITDDSEKYDLIHNAIDKIMIFGENKVSVIIVTFTTGQTIYLGYYSSKSSKYYLLFHPSNDIYFNTSTGKGYIRQLKEESKLNSDGSIYIGNLTGEMNEYGVLEFINHLDDEEFRRYY